mmetsp:Transcript_4000/g.7846  ORF Transcript_4000/g.7846 Transcript_4000/m.7846 type:complete len:178 (-) Transcript_4000:169-702(-)
MTDERIQALESVGFQWVLQHRVDELPGHTPPPKQISRKSIRDRQAQKERLVGSGKKQSQKWYDNYMALCDYKDKYGNCRVRAGKKKDSSYSKLGKWVDHQRQLYRGRHIGKNTSLTDDRIAALDEIGFEWVVVRRQSNQHVLTGQEGGNIVGEEAAEEGTEQEAEEEAEDEPETVGV